MSKKGQSASGQRQQVHASRYGVTAGEITKNAKGYMGKALQVGLISGEAFVILQVPP